MRDLDYVLKHVKAIRQCPNCFARWFIFENKEIGEAGLYRLGGLPPEECHRCTAFSLDIEDDVVMTTESWVTRDGKKIDD